MPSTFKNEELVKVQGKIYPVVGGRLRLPMMRTRIYQ
jgi:hypothetical protein